jgi:hypothetical protein
MAEFVLNEKISNAEAHSGEQMLTGVLEDEKLVAAETLYGAILKTMGLRNQLYPLNPSVQYFRASI